MKFFGRPWVVALLATLAVAFVAFQIFHPHWPKAAAPAGANSPVPGVPPAQTAAAGAAPVPLLVAIDPNYMELHLAHWLDAPQRDPFFLAKPVVPMVIPPNQVNPLTRLHLKAIWQQNGNGLAAINRGIYGAGDSVDGFLVVRIVDGGVWVELDGRKQLLRFAEAEPANRPN